MSKGEEVQLLEEQQGRSKVQLRSGLRGWLEAKDLKSVPPDSVNLDLPLKKSPSVASPSNMTLNSVSLCVKSVDVFSFGLETVDGELLELCRRLGGGHRCCPPAPAVAQALRRRGVPATLVLDARGFPDQEASRRHSGRHLTVLQALVRHRNFEHWLQRARRDILEKLQERRLQTDIHHISIYICISMCICI